MPKRNTGPQLIWRKDRKIYEIQWFERGQRKRFSTGTDHPQDAQNVFAKFIAERKRPDNTQCHPSERLIADVVADYIQEKGQYAKNIDTLTVQAEHIINFWGERTVSYIRENTCRDYCEYRQKIYFKKQTEKDKLITKENLKKLSNATLSRELSILSAAVNHDWKAGRITQNVYVWKPAAPPPRERFLSRIEAANLLRSARKYTHVTLHRRGSIKETRYFPGVTFHLTLFILLGLYTGARKEAILSLKWRQVDLEKGLIDFNIPGRERTNKIRPIIPIPNRLLIFLRYARTRAGELEHVITFKGSPIRDIKKSFAMAARTAGLEGVTPHTLRHTCATWIVSSGADLYVTGGYLGHTNSKTTMRYAHHSPNYLLNAKNAFNKR